MIGRTNARGDSLVWGATYTNYLPSVYASARNILKDSTHLYYRTGDLLTSKIGKMALSDMAVTYSASLSSINRLMIQGNYVYASIGNYVYEYAKSDLSQTQQSTIYGGTVYGEATDGTYLYVGGATTKTIRKYALTDLTSLVAESSALANTINQMVYDNNMLYVFSGSNIYAYDTATLTLQTTSTALGFTPDFTVKAIIDSGYIYYNDTTSATAIIYKIDTATLGTITSINMAGDGALYTISDFKVVSGIIYIVGPQEIMNKILLYSTCTTALANETAIESKAKITLIYSGLYVDTDYLYLGYYGASSILKIARGNI